MKSLPGRSLDLGSALFSSGTATSVPGELRESNLAGNLSLNLALRTYARETAFGRPTLPPDGIPGGREG
jgi:hypothetical protein